MIKVDFPNIPKFLMKFIRLGLSSRKAEEKKSRISANTFKKQKPTLITYNSEAVQLKHLTCWFIDFSHCMWCMVHVRTAALS